MSAAASVSLDRATINCATINRANSQHSTDDGFVFSRSQVEQFATREMRLNNARIYSSAAFDLRPQFCRAR